MPRWTTGRLERDRRASFAPQLIVKYQRRFPDFDDKIVSMYARGMSAREILGHLREFYGIDVSPDRVSAVARSPACPGRAAGRRRTRC
jgi:putative transposase